MGSFLTSSANGLVYSFRGFMMHGRDYSRVPMCFLRLGILSMQLGTSFGQECPCGRSQPQLCILPLIRSGLAGERRSWDHVCPFV